MARARVTVSGAALESKLKLSAADWQAVGDRLRTRIVQRTRRGTDAHGRTFAPYSASYAKAKAEQGEPSRVNLTSTDAGAHMLDNIGVDVPASGEVKVRLQFALAEKAKIAQYHMGEGRVDREFFLIGDEDETDLMALIRQRLAGT